MPGAVYVFAWDGGAWSEVQKLVASNGANDDRFAVSVSYDGIFVVVGADRRNNIGNYFFIPD